MKKLLTVILSLLILLSGCTFSFTVPKILRETNTEPSNTTEIPNGEMNVHFIDVGQGDCIFIQTDDENMLIDAGNPENGADIAAYLHSLGVTRLNDFIGTHPHADHLGGGAYIVREFNPEHIYMTEMVSSSYFFEKLLDTIDDMDISVETPKIGALYRKGSLNVKFLGPKKEFSGTNDNSIITRVDFGNTSALFTGDAEKAAEYELLSADADLDVDLFKAGHHGSSTSNIPEFLKAVSPEIAVIQCGRNNSYGHPHHETIERFKNLGADIYRCDEMGTIILKSDGERFVYVKSETISGDNESTLYIGNIKSKVFHLSTCKNLPSKANSVYFKTRIQAIEQGYKACGNCRP